MKRRVVITGLGAITPIGNDVNSMWESAKNGINGIDHITLFDVSNQKVKVAGEVKNFNPEDHLEPKEARRMDRTMVFGLVAATEAFEHSNLKKEDIDSDRFGVFVSSGIGGLWTINEEARKAHEKGVDRISPFFIPNAIINLVGGRIAIKYQAKGPVLPIVTACSSATNSIGEAFRYIRDGYIELAFAGGAEAPINELGVGGFASMKALNFTSNKDEASIPFDKRRSGFVIAEGAGVIILEELEHALKRKATIFAEMVGYGTTCDAFHITAPDETAYGITKCMENALLDGNVDPTWIDYINPHGTSTFYNDKIETLGIKNVFKKHAYEINIGATKSMHGHSLGAVGGIEAIISIKALMENIIPPTINYVEKDPECDLNYTPNVAVKRIVKYALSNSLGFGGQNATIIFKKWEDSNHVDK
ncbi:MAG: beta-ketoacyl-ACP synthase II [Firmicutes bacterium]|nr:beta-ketoacyl-ACP synthase II [Bacillota bacterium]